MPPSTKRVMSLTRPSRAYPHARKIDGGGLPKRVPGIDGTIHPPVAGWRLMGPGPSVDSDVVLMKGGGRENEGVPNPPPSSRVTASNVSDAQAHPSASVSISRRPRFEPMEPARFTFGRSRRAERSGSVSVQNAALQSIGTWIGDPTKLASLSVRSLIPPSPRRLFRSGRNLGIRGSPSGMISGTSHKRHQSPGPLADFGRSQRRAFVDQGVSVLIGLTASA